MDNVIRKFPVHLASFTPTVIGAQRLPLVCSQRIHVQRLIILAEALITLLVITLIVRIATMTTIVVGVMDIAKLIPIVTILTVAHQVWMVESLQPLLFP